MLKLIDHTPIVLRVSSDSNQYLESGGTLKQYATIIEESHSGMWDGSQLIVPHDALLLVEAVVTANDSSISLSIFDEHYATDSQKIVSIVRVKKSDVLRIVWDVSAPSTAMGTPVGSHLNIVELAV